MDGAAGVLNNIQHTVSRIVVIYIYPFDFQKVVTRSHHDTMIDRTRCAPMKSTGMVYISIKF